MLLFTSGLFFGLSLGQHEIWIACRANTSRPLLKWRGQPVNLPPLAPFMTTTVMMMMMTPEHNEHLFRTLPNGASQVIPLASEGGPPQCQQPPRTHMFTSGQL